MISATTRILLEATEPTPDEIRGKALIERIARQEDPDRLMTVAAQEGLACLLYGHVKHAGGSLILPSGFFQGLQRLYEQTVAFNLRLIHDCRELLALLNRNGLEVVLLQGMALLHEIYHDNIGLRPMTDIDLWVRRGDYPRLIDLVTGLGFRPDRTYPHTFRRGITTLDLHTDLFWADRIRARRHLLRGDQDALYRESVHIDFEGAETRILSPRDQVLYLGLHAFKHNLDRLIWLVDIRLLLKGFAPDDWADLVDRARDLGLERHLKRVLHLLHRLFQLDPPPEARRLLGDPSPGMFERRLLRRRVEGTPLPSWGPLLLLLPERGMAKRLSYLMEVCLPREEVLRQIFVDYPGLKKWQLYRMRIRQLFGKIRLASKGL